MCLDNVYKAKQKFQCKIDDFKKFITYNWLHQIEKNLYHHEAVIFLYFIWSFYIKFYQIVFFTPMEKNESLLK